MKLSQHNRPVGAPSNGVSQDVLMTYGKRLKQAQLENRRLARGHYENFVVTSFLLPRKLHQAFYDIYAFCRTADDIADESSSSQEALNGLASMERDLASAFASTYRTANPERILFIAMAETVHRFHLRLEPFMDLLTAFRQDQKKSDYVSETELLEYCELSANPVGRILLALVGVHSEQANKLSDSICTGLQLVNFLQDIRGDYNRGRIYLPKEERSDFGVDFVNLHQIECQRAWRRLIQKRCAEARGYFEKGEELQNHVPKWFSPTVRLILGGGLEAIKAIEKKDFDVLTGCPKVSKTSQMWLLSRAVISRFIPYALR